MTRFKRNVAFLMAILTLCFGMLAGSAESAAYQKLDPPIDVTMTKLVYQDHAEKYAKLGETVDNNRWIQLFRDELGINITYRFVATAGDSYDTKLKMMLASSKPLPDIFAVGLSDMAQLQEAGRIQDMTDVYEKNISPLARSIIMADGGGALKSCMIDGRLYAVPQVTSGYDTLRWLYIRRDWMEKLNLKAPQTIDDLMNIMKAFVEQDPDGNGQNDTLATYIDKGFWTQLEGFFWMFGSYPNGFVMRDGKLQYGSVLPETKEALRAVQNMYKNGWLDQEFFVKDFTQAKEAVTNGKVGVVMGYHWLPLDVLNPMHDKFPDVEWDCYPWPTAAAGVPATVMMQSSLSSALVVSSEFAHPEVAVQMVNLYCEKLYDPEKSDYNYWGDDFEKGVQGVGQLGPLYIIHPNLNLDPYRDIMKVYHGEITVDQMNSASKHYYDAVNSIWAWNVMWGTGEHTTGTVLDYLVSNPQYMIQNAYVGTPTETQAERGGSLEEIRNTAFSQIMTGKLDVDAGFDKFVQDYMAAGGQDIEDEVNAWYQSNQQ